MTTLRRLAALAAALTLAATPMALAEETENTVDEDTILQEERGQIPSEEDDGWKAEIELAVVPEVGSFMWYMTPALPIAQHSFVDIYPEESPVYMQEDAAAPGGYSWQYAFTLEETGGYDFYPSVMTVTYFSAGEEIAMVSREVYDAEQLSAWWGSGCIAAGSAVTYKGQLNVQDISAVAVSVIGNDPSGLEMEFHGVAEFIQQHK